MTKLSFSRCKYLLDKKTLHSVLNDNPDTEIPRKHSRCSKIERSGLRDTTTKQLILWTGSPASCRQIKVALDSYYYS